MIKIRGGEKEEEEEIMRVRRIPLSEEVHTLLFLIRINGRDWCWSNIVEADVRTKCTIYSNRHK